MQILKFISNVDDIDLGNSPASFSNPEGKLTFFSNGCGVFNKMGITLANGDSINYPGPLFDSECPDFWYRTHQGIMAIPTPGEASKIQLLSLRFDNDFFGGFYFPSSLLLTTIDTHDFLNPTVISKNELILKDTFFDQLTAVRHGNGRDWWIYLPKLNSNIVYAFLSTPDGIKGPFIKDLGFKMRGTVKKYDLGRAVFSPNGSFYARVDNVNDAQIACFDRCTGEFACMRTIKIKDPDRLVLTLSFSPDSKLLYVVTGKKIYQYEVDAEDIESSKVQVGEWDKYFEENEPAATMYQPQIAPDGRIYISSQNATHWLHVIDKPNQKGVSCDFRCRGIDLPIHLGFTLPHYPNYNLFDWANSPCDTLNIDATNSVDSAKWVLKTVSIAPNPANDFVKISSPNCKNYSISIFDYVGRIVFEITDKNAFDGVQISTENWPAGIYFVVFNFFDKKSETQKLIIAH